MYFASYKAGHPVQHPRDTGRHAPAGESPSSEERMRLESQSTESAWVDGAGRLNAAPAARALLETIGGIRPAEASRATGSPYAQRIAVRSIDRIAIVPVDGIARLAADDNYVRIFADRVHLHKETLTGLCARLDPAQFLRIHRSHAVSLRVLRELEPQPHGEFTLVLADGTKLRSGRSYRKLIESTLGLA
jgi:DNA-binding LytR/AlgR family response regulator